MKKFAILKFFFQISFITIILQKLKFQTKLVRIMIFLNKIFNSFNHRKIYLRKIIIQSNKI